MKKKNAKGIRKIVLAKETVRGMEDTKTPTSGSGEPLSNLPQDTCPAWCRPKV